MMYCKYCGSPIPEGEQICPSCGQASEFNASQQERESAYAAPENTSQTNNTPTPINSTAYLVWAILVTVMCCLPLGIPAIIYATKIDKEWALGNYQAAYDNAKKAKNFAIGGAIASAVFMVLYFIFIIALAMAGIMS